MHCQPCHVNPKLKLTLRKVYTKSRKSDYRSEYMNTRATCYYIVVFFKWLLDIFNSLQVSFFIFDFIERSKPNFKMCGWVWTSNVMSGYLILLFVFIVDFKKTTYDILRFESSVLMLLLQHNAPKLLLN